MLPDPLALANPIVIAAAGGTVLLVAAVALSGRWTPAIWVGTLMFYLGLAPTMGFVGYSWVSASDKYAYLPAIGLLLMLGWALERIWSGGAIGTLRIRQVAAVAGVAALAGLLGLGTRGYLRQWRNTETLTRYMFDLAPRSPQLNYSMGLVLYEQTRPFRITARPAISSRTSPRRRTRWAWF